MSAARSLRVVRGRPPSARAASPRAHRRLRGRPPGARAALLRARPGSPPGPSSRPGESGQASVELAVLAPLFVLVVLAAAQLLAAGAARELADHAAEAAAVAILQGEEPWQAAREAVPGWSRGRMRVRVDGRRVHVRLRPPSPIPAIAELLEADGEADAGPRAR